MLSERWAFVLEIGDAFAGKPGELTGVGRQDRLHPELVTPFRPAGKGVEGIGVDDDGNVGGGRSA